MSTPYTDTSGELVGYHEVLALGYNSQGLIVQNSWGTAWGAQGYLLLGWEVVANDLFTADIITGTATTAVSGRKGAANDLDGDGYGEIFARDSAGTVYYYPNSGSATKPFSSRVKIASGWQGFSRLLAADVNDDGLADMIGHDAKGNLWLYPNPKQKAPYSTRSAIGTGFHTLTKWAAGDTNGLCSSRTPRWPPSPSVPESRWRPAGAP